MNLKGWKVCVLAPALAVLALLPANSQTSGQKQDSPGQASTVSKDKTRLRLDAADRVSSSDAVREAAEQAAKKPAAKNLPEDSSEPAVTELQPAAPDPSATGSSAELRSVDEKKSPLKNVHGTVYGSAEPGDAGNRRAGGAVGASSKGGKAHIYVESDRSRSTSPTPR